MMIRMIFLVALLTWTAQNAYAQTFEAGIFVGAAGYNGDIDVNAQNWWSAKRPAVGLVGKYRLSERWLLRGQLVSTRLTASEKNSSVAWQQARGFAFTNRLNELSILGEYDFFNIGNFKLYGLGGVALAFHTPKTDYNNSDIQNTDSQSNKFTTSFVIPLGLGVKYPIAPRWTLGAEGTVRYTFTDYFDGISNLANPKKNDAYWFAGLNLSYEFGFGKSAKNRDFKNGFGTCPKF